MCPIILILKIADIMLNFATKKPYNRTIIVHFCKAFQVAPLVRSEPNTLKSLIKSTIFKIPYPGFCNFREESFQI